MSYRLKVNKIGKHYPYGTFVSSFAGALNIRAPYRWTFVYRGKTSKEIYTSGLMPIYWVMVRE